MNDIYDYVGLLEQNSVPYALNQSLAKYCTYGVGGNCAVMAFPKTEDQARIAASHPCRVLGCGSNILVSDGGYDGVIINTCYLNRVDVRGITVVCQSGARLSRVKELAEMDCLSGLEFTIGIPASVGGAVCMNAGCFSKSVGDLVAYVKTNKGVYNAINCEFGYRQSVFCDREDEVILSVCFMLKPGEADIIEGKNEKFKKLRKSAQPKGKTCGSVFINDGYFAGKVIDQAGLKGFRIGGARVSDVHANFIINEGGSAQDIYDLIAAVKDRVYQTQGIKLKEELKYIGNFDDKS